jgi:hypothetical protein
MLTNTKQRVILKVFGSGLQEEEVEYEVVIAVGKGPIQRWSIQGGSRNSGSYECGDMQAYHMVTCS